MKLKSEDSLKKLLENPKKDALCIIGKSILPSPRAANCVVN